MNWKREAINDLSKYRNQQQSLENIPQRMAALKEDIQSARSAKPDNTPVQGGGNMYEDRILNNIITREKLKVNYAIVSRIVSSTEKALNSLSQQQRRVLELFYIDRQQGHVERLCQELGYEQARIYQIKDNALYDFTIALYGLSDL